MASEDYPLPEVAEALSPFIKPRDEVTNIRRGLQSYLQNQLKSEGSSLSSINLVNPQVSQLDSPPPGLSGVRKAYWKALQAHTEAQAKDDALKTELDQLKHSKTVSGDKTRTPSIAAANEGYISLLRQREKHRKLKVIERALLNISSVGSEASANNLEDVVKKKIGDLPSPPGTQPSFGRSPEVEAKVLELKKAVVSAKRRVEDQKSHTATHVTNGVSEVPTQAEILGLQKALQELTSWMETQLTVIANSEAEVQNNESSLFEHGTPAKSPVPVEEIESLYEHYLEARQRLIETVNESREDEEQEPTSLDIGSSSSKSVDASKAVTKSSGESILPYMSTLVSMKQQEQALMQSNAYIRRQLSVAEEETARLIRRLADESHLVQPGASSGKDWADAAKAAGAAADEFIKQRLVTGEEAADSAKQSLQGIRNLPKSLPDLAE